MADGYAVLLHFGAQPELVRLQSLVSVMLPKLVRLTDPDTFHITLAYATGQGDIDAVRERLTQEQTLPDAPLPTFGVIIDGIGVFDTPNDGYAFYLNVRPGGALGNYQVQMYFAMSDAGFELSEFSRPEQWKPHITLGYSSQPSDRIKPSVSVMLMPPIALMPTSIQFTDPDEMVVGEVMLKQMKRRVTYNGVSVEASDRRTSSRADKKYQRTVTIDGKDYLVHYGDPDMPMRRTNDDARADFLSRHNCDSKKDPRSPGFWACYDWEETKMRRTKEGRVISRRNFDRLRAIRDALQEILEDARLSFEDVGKSLVIKRGADGRRYLGILSSNPYRDRDEEFVAHAALEAMVDAEWDGETYKGTGKVLFWHEGEPIADIVWADTEKGFLIEIARERDSPWAHTMFDLIERTDIDWGASIGFKTRVYDELVNAKGDVVERVYRQLRRVETSVLPRAFAANPFTNVMRFKMGNKKNQLRQLWLIRNAPAAAKLEAGLRKGAAETADALDGQGVERKQRKVVEPPPADGDDDGEDTVPLDELKALDVEGLAGSLESMIAELLGDQTPEDLSDRIVALISENMVDAPAAEESDETEDVEMSSDPDEDDDDTEAEPVITGKAVGQLVTLLEDLIEGQAATADLADRVKSFDALTKLPDQIAALTKRLGKIEKALAGGPRAASAVADTEVDEDDDLLETVKEAEADERVSAMLPGLFKK